MNRRNEETEVPEYPELFVLRHGQTEWNLEGKYQGQLDSPLTNLGISQAKQQGDILRAHVAGRNLPAYASPQRRAARTAEIALLPLGQQAKPDSRLMEVHFGSWEGKTRAEMAAMTDERTPISPFQRYFGAPKGERFPAVESRCRAFLERLEGPSIAFTHGITSRILRGLWLGLSIDEMLNLPIGQGCVYHLHTGAEQGLQAARANPMPAIK